MTLIVYTARMSRSWKEDPDALDVTIKSSRGLAAVFAPDNWEMVMGVKRGTVPTAGYRDWYLGVLRRSYCQERLQWEALLARKRAVLLCYCHPWQFCHRHILAAVLAKLGADYRGEILPEGQLLLPSSLPDTGRQHPSGDVAVCVEGFPSVASPLFHDTQ